MGLRAHHWWCPPPWDVSFEKEESAGGTVCIFCIVRCVCPSACASTASVRKSLEDPVEAESGETS